MMMSVLRRITIARTTLGLAAAIAMGAATCEGLRQKTELERAQSSRALPGTATNVSLYLDPENSEAFNAQVLRALRAGPPHVDPTLEYSIQHIRTLPAPLPSGISRALPVLEEKRRMRTRNTFTIIAQQGTFYIDSIPCTTKACETLVAAAKPDENRYMGVHYNAGALISVADRTPNFAHAKQLFAVIYHEDGHRRGAGHTIGKSVMSTIFEAGDPRTHQAYPPAVLEEIARHDADPRYISPRSHVPKLGELSENDYKALRFLNNGNAAYHAPADAAALASYAVGLQFAEHPKLRDELDASLQYMRRIQARPDHSPHWTPTLK